MAGREINPLRNLSLICRAFCACREKKIPVEAEYFAEHSGEVWLNVDVPEKVRCFVGCIADSLMERRDFGDNLGEPKL